jgi:lipopolysaccharide exporter
MNEDLKEKTIKNIGYNTIAKIIALLFQAAANIILSRNLSSSDYGIVGFGLIFISFLNQFNDVGISSAVVQRRELDEKGLYTAFTLKTLLGFSLFIITFIIAPLAPYFFDNSAVANVVRLLALNFLINIFAFLPISLLTRELNYRKISLANICSTIINSSMAIVLVLNGFGYWSLVFANLIATIVLALGLNILRPVKIRISFDRAIAKEFMHYGWKLFATGVVIFTIFNADNFIVGSVKGSSMLGYYMIGFNWGSMVCVLLFTIVHSVLFPTFSKIQGNRGKLKASYLKTLEYVSIIAILINMTLFLTAKEFLIYILGRGSDKWLPALTSLRILCIYGIARALLEPIGSVVMAVGKTELLLKSNVIAAALEILFIYPAITYFGIEGAAVVATLAYSSQYFFYFSFLKEELGINEGELFRAIAPSISPTIMILAVYLGCEYYFRFNNTIGLFVLKLTMSFIGYFIFYGVVTKWKLIKEARDIIKDIKAI